MLAIIGGAPERFAPYIAVMDGDLQHDESLLPQIDYRPDTLVWQIEANLDDMSPQLVEPRVDLAEFAEAVRGPVPGMDARYLVDRVDHLSGERVGHAGDSSGRRRRTL